MKDPKTSGVLITDGSLRIALAVLRSLGKRNIETVVAAEHDRALSFFSKYCRKKLLYPSSIENRGQFVKGIQKIVRRTKLDVLFPVSDWTLLPISEHRDKIAPYIKLPLASHEAVEKAFDKSLTLKAAIDEGIPVPRTFFVSNLRELKKASKELTYPVVIKPRRSWVWKKDKGFFRRPIYVNSASQLLSLYGTIHDQFPFPLIQEYIPGENFSVAVLCNNSRPKAVCGIKVYRGIPVTGGNSVFRESVKLNPEMKKYALRLLEVLNWHGIAEVEFKMDPRDSIPKLMEINGRFWGSLEVATASGVDFPYLLYHLAVDGNVQPVFNYKVGIKLRWLGGDIIHLLSVLRGASADCGIEYPNRWRTLINFLKFYEVNMKYDSFSKEDPLPFFPITRLLRRK